MKENIKIIFTLSIAIILIATLGSFSAKYILSKEGKLTNAQIDVITQINLDNKRLFEEHSLLMREYIDENKLLIQQNTKLIELVRKEIEAMENEEKVIAEELSKETKKIARELKEAHGKGK